MDALQKISHARSAVLGLMLDAHAEGREEHEKESSFARKRLYESEGAMRFSRLAWQRAESFAGVLGHWWAFAPDNYGGAPPFDGDFEHWRVSRAVRAPRVWDARHSVFVREVRSACERGDPTRGGELGGIVPHVNNRGRLFHTSATGRVSWDIAYDGTTHLLINRKCGPVVEVTIEPIGTTRVEFDHKPVRSRHWAIALDMVKTLPDAVASAIFARMPDFYRKAFSVGPEGLTAALEAVDADMERRFGVPEKPKTIEVPNWKPTFGRSRRRY